MILEEAPQRCGAFLLVDQSGGLADIEAMPIEIKPSTGNAAGAAASVTSRMVLSENIPEISEGDLKALLTRSKEARHLRREFDGRLETGGCYSRHEVLDLVKRAHGKDGKARGDHAIVMAYYAQNHAEVFAPDAQPVLGKFLAQQDWPALMADLHQFMEDLKQKEAEAKHAEQVKQERLKDDIKHDDAKRGLVKNNGTKADRQRELKNTEAQKAEQRAHLKVASPADLDDELTASGRLPLSDVERTKLGLMKKGFANKD